METTNYRSKFAVGRYSCSGTKRCCVEENRSESLHEEADINIRPCMACFKDEVNCLKIICADSDIFVLLTVYVFRQGSKSKVLMEAFDTSRSLIDINEVAKKHAEIVPSLISAHALSGSDSVPKLYGIGSNIVIKHLKDQNLSLSSLGDTAVLLANVYAESIKLISSCYGVKNANSLSEVRFSVWGKRTRKKLTSTSKLESLPPATEVFILNALCVHYQACVWYSCLQARPPEIDPWQVKYLIIESDSVYFFVWFFGHSHLFA